MTEPIDVFSDWIDKLEDKKKLGSSSKPFSTKSAKKSRYEESQDEEIDFKTKTNRSKKPDDEDVGEAINSDDD